MSLTKAMADFAVCELCGLRAPLGWMGAWLTRRWSMAGVKKRCDICASCVEWLRGELERSSHAG